MNQKEVHRLLDCVNPFASVKVTAKLLEEKLRIFKAVYPSQWYFISTIKNIKQERLFKLRVEGG